MSLEGTAATSTPSIRVESASFAINGATLVRDISFSFTPPGITGILGPNGAGKSTLLRLAAGLLAPTRGAVLLGQTPLTRISRREIARRIALVPQDTHLEFPFTAMEIVLMGRGPHLGRFQWPSGRDRAIAQECMECTDTVQFADRPVTALSGGERQRVLLARALATQSPFIFLDEPTANLDIEHVLHFMELSQTFCREKGTGMLMATHDLALAYRFCHRVLLLHQGELVGDGKPHQVLSPENIRTVFRVEASLLKGEGEKGATLYFEPAPEPPDENPKKT
jgi:iron complex transport system ATP-binding protein